MSVEHSSKEARPCTGAAHGDDRPSAAPYHLAAAGRGTSLVPLGRGEQRVGRPRAGLVEISVGGRVSKLPLREERDRLATQACATPMHPGFELGPIVCPIDVLPGRVLDAQEEVVTHGERLRVDAKTGKRDLVTSAGREIDGCFLPLPRLELVMMAQEERVIV